MNICDIFSDKDLQQIKGKRIEFEVVTNQLLQFKKGFPPLQITSPATIGNGILKLTEEDILSYVKKYEDTILDVFKFVPASGSATRMFKSLFAFLDEFDGSRETSEKIKDKKINDFFSKIDQFAFYTELNQKLIEQEKMTVFDAIKEGKHNLIVDILMNKRGLNYGGSPKALLPFHTYEDHIRTAAQEHLSEGFIYAQTKGKLEIHFTVSPDHRETFEKHITASIAKEKRDVDISISFSEQNPSTEIIASTTDFAPFRDEKGNLLFRPAGHGALLENLNTLSADVIFIKNIDNVVPEHLQGERIKYKKALAGLLVSCQEKAFEILVAYERGGVIKEKGTQLLGKMGTHGNFSEEEIAKMLDRPIRVCGMVKNQGESGGGPFWVKRKMTESLQIVEAAQIDKSDKDQLALFKNGTHFNPVDIVCGMKNYRGEKYDLQNYRDEDTGFISEKSYNGKQLLAMELPGLWNGGMANWNTLFVEVPQQTFSPVKTVTDLLKSLHR